MLLADIFIVLSNSGLFLMLWAIFFKTCIF